MEQQKYLADTNAVIDYLGKKLPGKGMAFMNDVIDEIPNVSVITKIELLGFNGAEDYYQLLVDFVNDATVIDLTDDIVERTITVRKKHKIKLPDAIIAATALVYKLTIISNNNRDFSNIKGLKTINPWQ